LIEARARHQPVGHAVADKGLLKDARLGIGTIHYSAVAPTKFSPADQFLDFVDDELRFLLLGIGLHNFGQYPRLVFRPQPLGFSLLVGRDDVVGRLQNHLSGAVVLLQQDYLRFGIVFFKVKYVPQVGKAPGVNRLVRVANDTQVTVLAGQLFHQLVLDEVGVLKLIHLNVQVPRLIAREHRRILLEELHHLEQKVVKVERVAFGEELLIALIDALDNFLEVAVAVL